MKSLVLLLSILIMSLGQQTDCEKYVEKLIQDIIDFNIADLPLASIMYSGITTNNPGQMEECMNSVNNSYYLVEIKNSSQPSTYTGLCVPAECTVEDIEIALEFWHCQVYDYPDYPGRSMDALAIVGLVVIAMWLTILIVWSCVLSFKQPVINEYMKSDEPQRVSINDEQEEPLPV